MRSFPERFDFTPEVWRGSRARNFTGREDAFQQLVGAALRAELGRRVQEGPTEGRDGGIDAYIEEGAPACALLPALPGPTIVECKDNDESRGRAAENVVAAWKKVEEKLARQAAAGWPGLYGPWARVRGYVYVTSARLSPQARTKLKGLIERFFAGLRAARVEKVCVLDWSDVRPVLDEHPRLADAWLGTHSDVLVAHGDREAAVAASFGRYLTDIPFVPPDAADDAHPDRLFERVAARSQGGGVLVVGPGGVGKTRLLFEVARRADRQGWRVLHAVEGESTLRYQQLAEEILWGRGDVLVVADYFDRLSPDIATIRRRLLPEAAARNLRIGFLASARVRGRVMTSPEIEAFFDVVELRHDDRRAQRILVEMAGRVAPTAVRTLGAEHIARVAGEVPAIALLVLEAVEHLAAEGALDVRSLTGVRPGDLVHWVRSRLHEDRLLVPVSEWEDAARVDARSVAAAAVLAACPQRVERAHELAFDVVGRFAEVSGERPLLRREAMGCVDALQAQGWLLVRDEQLVVCHDVVADEMLVEVLRDSHGRLREELLEVLLAPALRSARLLGRFAIVLGRLFGQVAGIEAELRAGTTRWLVAEAVKIGAALAAVGAGEAAYALHAILTGPPWNDVVLRVWDEVVVPWRERHVDAEASWPVHAAMLALRDLPPERAASTVQMAMQWVGKHGGTEDAAAVLVYLLDRVDLDTDTESRATTTALLWQEAHRDAEMAPSVLGMLLRSPRVATDAASRVAQGILDWCHRHQDTARAGFALGMLLARDDLGPELGPRAIGAALAWLEEHRDAGEAGFVLASLVDRDGQVPDSSSEIIERSLNWCERHSDTLAAGFVLNALLRHDRPVPADARRTAQRAQEWLRRPSGVLFEKALVLASLIGSPHLTVSEIDGLVRTSMTWIERYGDYPQSAGILQRLLMGVDLVPEIRARIAPAALRWCEGHRNNAQVGIALCGLLDQPLEPAIMDRVVREAKGFLEAHRDSELFAVVLGGLIAQREFLPEDAPFLENLARDWLAEHRGSDLAGFVFMGLLRDEIDGGQDVETIEWASTWLAGRRGQWIASLVLMRLLAREDCKSDVIAAAADWLEEHGRRWEAVLILPPLLDRVQPGTSSHPRIERLACRWLKSQGRIFQALTVYRKLLERPALRDPEGPARVAMQWLERYGDRSEAGVMLCALLRRSDLGPATSARITGFVVAWLAAHGGRDDACMVLYWLLCRGDLEDSALASAVNTALQWIDQRSPNEEGTGILLEVLLSSPFWVRHGDALCHVVSDALARALVWLEAHPDSELAGPLLTHICLNPRFDRETTEMAADRACEWIDRHPRDPMASFAIAELLAHFKREDPRVERTERAAVEWTNEHREKLEADLLLRNFLVYTDRAAESWPSMLFLSLFWLGQHGRGAPPHALFNLFFLDEGAGGCRTRYARGLLEEQLAVLAKLLTTVGPASVTLALPALLALASCKGTARLRRKYQSLARRALRHTGLSQEVRQAFVIACYRLVEAGAWPSQEVAERTLSEAGIERPH